jgi:hypothetical protein
MAKPIRAGWKPHPGTRRTPNVTKAVANHMGLDLASYRWVNMFKLAIACFLALIGQPVIAESYRFSEQCCDQDEGIIVFSQKVHGDLHLCLRNLKDNSIKEITIDDKSSTPVICGGSVIICAYGANKIRLYDHELRELSEVDTEKGSVPFYSACGSSGKFLYVYVVRFDDSGGPPKNFVYKYRHVNGTLTYEDSSPVNAVGKLVEFRGSMFVVNETACEVINFEKR